MIGVILDLLATLLLTCAAFIGLLICKQSDFLSEHAGMPKSGVDPMRVAIMLIWAFLVWRVWA